MDKNGGDLKMSVNGVGRNYYENNAATTRSTKSINNAEKAINADTKYEGAVSSSKQMKIKNLQVLNSILLKSISIKFRPIM